MTNTDTGTPGHSGGDGPHVGLILALTIRGLSVGNYPDMTRVAQTAESHGFDSAWLCDHFLTLSPDDYVRDAGITDNANGDAPAAQGPSSIPLLECWTALSALSRDTTSLRLGTSVLCNSYRHPAVLAKMAATLDVISGGRVDLGLGAGWFQQEFEAYGIPFPSTGDRVSALAESLQVMRSVWTEANPRFSGDFYTIDGAICDPLPVQKPHPPLWVGGEGLRVNRIAVRHANGVNVRWWSAEKCAERRALLDSECEAIDRDPSTLELSVTTVLAPTESPAVQQQLRARFKSIPESGLITGSADACVEQIREYQAAGINHFLFTIPDVADSDYLDVVGEQILPHLDTAGAPNPPDLRTHPLKASRTMTSDVTSQSTETAGEEYLRPTEYIDSDHPTVVETARRITEGVTTDVERLGRIYHHVRDLPYDILASFRYLATGQTAASDVLENGVAFCMGKASSFVALARAAGIPARVAFQALDAPEMEFLSPEVRVLWGGPVGRPLPWHSLGEAFVDGRWVKLDATIDAPTASKLGKPYAVDYDGHTDIPTVEGPVLRENGSYADYPAEVADWYVRVAREVLDALESTAAHERVAADDVLWSGPDAELVRRQAVG